MKKMVFYRLAIVLIVSPILLSVAPADGFWDQGFRIGTFRTDFEDPNTGLWPRPLIQSNTCLFPATVFAIPCKPFDTSNQIKSVYDHSYSFYWPQSAPRPRHPNNGFWVLSVNNEDVVSNFNLGPPNQSLPIKYSDVLPWQGPQLNRITANATMNIAMELRGVRQQKKRIHLAINTKYQPGNESFSQDEGSIPFLGFGAMQARGNKGVALGALNDDSKPHMLHFTTKMWGTKKGVRVPKIAPSKPLRPNILSYMLFVYSEWGGAPRGIILQLFHRHQEFSCPSGFSAIRDRYGVIRNKVDDSGYCRSRDENGRAVTKYKLQEVDWNWPIKQSYFSLGADFAYIDVEDLRTVCGNFSKTTVSGNPNNGWRLGYREESTYDIDLQELFECVDSLDGFNEPMPNHYPVPITGVQWTLEASGVDGLLWASIEDMWLR